MGISVVPSGRFFGTGAVKEHALSSLTKVFVVLLSLVSIFLCGVVVTFNANRTNYKRLYELEQHQRMAAQVQAVLGEEYLSQGIAHYQAMDELKNGQILALAQQSSDRLGQLASEAQARAQAEGAGATAVALSKSLQGMVDDLYASQNAIQAALNEAHARMITAETQVIEVRYIPFRQNNHVQLVLAKLYG